MFTLGCADSAPSIRDGVPFSAAMYRNSPSELAVRSAVASALEASGVRCTDAVVVACSGGIDSAVLADVAMSLSSSAEIGPVTLAYIDHGLRPNTAADAVVVETLAEIGGGQFRMEAVDVDRDQASLEDAARRARYRALEAIADELDARYILTAHTASDQAETVLLRIVRGTGVSGLAAIPRRRGRILRPLLEVPRSVLEAYRAERELPTIEDPSNADPVFARNRMRHQHLPMLRAENPRIDEALCRLADAASEQRAALEYAASELLARVVSSDRRVDIPALLAAPSGVSKRVLSMLADSLGSEGFEARHLGALMRMLRGPARGTIQLDLPGIAAIRQYDTLELRTAGFVATHQVRQVVVEGPEPPYEIRRWRAGDRMRPVRLRGHSKKLSDLFGEAKIPREARPLALVVARQADGAIEWAEHLGPAWQSQVQVSLR